LEGAFYRQNHISKSLGTRIAGILSTQFHRLAEVRPQLPLFERKGPAKPSVVVYTRIGRVVRNISLDLFFEQQIGLRVFLAIHP
jgi:hypothetical protein